MNRKTQNSGCLKDFGYLDGGFDILTSHVIYFRNPQDHKKAHIMILTALGPGPPKE